MHINHNIPAQLANTQSIKSENRLSSSLQRLSSGYKITKASDDPAGKAISQKMRNQIRALERASDNGADGNSVLQTAEGALTEVSSMLQRVRELAVKAANETYVLEDKETIQAEIDQLLDEVDRISETTEFNNKYLLNGSIGRTAICKNDNVSITNVSSEVDAGDYEITVDAMGTKATATINYAPDGTDHTIYLNAIPIEISATDTTASAKQKVLEVCSAINISLDGNTLTTNVAGSAQSISVGYDPDRTTWTTTTGTDAEITLGTQFNAGSVSWTASGNCVEIVDRSGFTMTLEIKEDFADADFTVSVFDAGSMNIQIGANEGQFLEINIPEVSARTLGLRTTDGTNIVNVCTLEGAAQAIATVDDAITKLSSIRSTIGAYQNRLEHTISSLDIAVENMTDAMSRITDTDMADEMTQYTQSDVLSQAAASMLAQANSRPQQIMSILQG